MKPLAWVHLHNRVYFLDIPTISRCCASKQRRHVFNTASIPCEKAYTFWSEEPCPQTSTIYSTVWKYAVCHIGILLPSTSGVSEGDSKVGATSAPIIHQKNLTDILPCVSLLPAVGVACTHIHLYQNNIPVMYTKLLMIVQAHPNITFCWYYSAPSLFFLCSRSMPNPSWHRGGGQRKERRGIGMRMGSTHKWSANSNY